MHKSLHWLIMGIHHIESIKPSWTVFAWLSAITQRDCDDDYDVKCMLHNSQVGRYLLNSKKEHFYAVGT